MSLSLSLSLSLSRTHSIHTHATTHTYCAAQKTHKNNTRPHTLKYTLTNTYIHTHRRGAYSANAWGVVQTLSWPGSAASVSMPGEGSVTAYGAIQETPLPCTLAQSLTACTPPAGTPSVTVGEWGVSVDLSGQWLIVGAYKSSVSPGTYTGAAFMYQRIASNGDFRYRVPLTSATTSNGHCGWDVAISGTYSVVGCYGSAAVAGSVYFYENSDPDGSSTGSPSYGQVCVCQYHSLCMCYAYMHSLYACTHYMCCSLKICTYADFLFWVRRTKILVFLPRM